ncbi:fasciclin domain-containing protein [Methylobacterium sp. NEAU K]|nr:fasciclin domain-containing protein [Methylobacterium sp. NEAU K]MDP4006550.1 fasciclin domain-containing protein [Methylobacterium sp. NEAU K]
MTRMFKVAGLTLAIAVSGAGALGFAAQAADEKTVMVGGAPMYPSKTIVENAVNSKDHTTLVAAVKAAGLVDTLNGPGPFTVFAPTNEAFAKLPAGTVDTLVKPENKATLTKILTYHVVPGRMTAADLEKEIKAGKGKATLKTVEGETLTAEEKGGKIELVDAKGGRSMVTIADVMQSNGVIHVVDTVLMPK